MTSPVLTLTKALVDRILEKYPNVDLIVDKRSEAGQDGNNNVYTTKVYKPKEGSNYPFSRLVSTDMYVSRTEVQSAMVRAYGHSNNALPHLAYDIFQNAPDCDTCTRRLN
ncbi:major capsid protein L1 [Acrasis kona]|uniref:Major capsid protein L1 n=1 Tax=Acrasis kona TaxID=1008807 RepID=A0AAW2YXW3_9EUKA